MLGSATIYSPNSVRFTGSLLSRRSPHLNLPAFASSSRVCPHACMPGPDHPSHRVPIDRALAAAEQRTADGSEATRPTRPADYRLLVPNADRPHLPAFPGPRRPAAPRGGHSLPGGPSDPGDRLPAERIAD